MANKKTKFSELSISMAIKNLIKEAEKPLSQFRPPHRYGIAERMRMRMHDLFYQVYVINKNYHDPDKLPAIQVFIDIMYDLKIMIEECNALNLFAKKGSKSAFMICKCIQNIDTEIYRWRNHIEKGIRLGQKQKQTSPIDTPHGVDMLTRPRP